MTVKELLKEKFEAECREGMIITYNEGERSYTSDSRDEFAEQTYSERDVMSYQFYFGDDFEPNEMSIELK